MEEARVIINADDFGQSSETNEGIVQAHRNGIVTSTSLMVFQPFAKEAVALSGEFAGLSIGLHLDLGEWRLNETEWEAIYSVVDIQNLDAVLEECKRQIGRFEQLMGRMPSHIDSHQHVHNKSFLKPVARFLSLEYGLPVRHSESAPDYCGKFYGQDEEGQSRLEWTTVDAFCKILSEIRSPFTEICCHPASGEVKNSMYCSERINELEVLCSPEVRECIDAYHLKLINFVDYGALRSYGE